jgi:succinate dehydrogenase/fumarate reductase flavoprotein subunit
MRKSKGVFVLGTLACVAAIAATAFGGNISSRVSEQGRATMASIEEMTLRASNLPAQSFHAI